VNNGKKRRVTQKFIMGKTGGRGGKGSSTKKGEACLGGGVPGTSKKLPGINIKKRDGEVGVGGDRGLENQLRCRRIEGGWDGSEAREGPRRQLLSAEGSVGEGLWGKKFGVTRPNICRPKQVLNKGGTRPEDRGVPEEN